MTCNTSIIARAASVAALTSVIAGTMPATADGPIPIRTQLIASGGYVYGFPAVLMSETMRLASEFPYVCGLGGPVNTFTHKLDRPDPDFRGVVRPNVDTLYSSAFLDLSLSPMRLEIPAVTDRYYLMAMLDAWTNNFAAPGTQTNQGEAMNYLIAGPDWQGETPAGYELIRAPTDVVWIIGRTEVRGENDIEAANAVQLSYVLEPLNGDAPVRQEGDCRAPESMATPFENVRAMSGMEFFSALDGVLSRTPPPTDDESALEDLGRIGFGPDARFAPSQLSERNQNALDNGLGLGQRSVDQAISLAQRSAVWLPDPQRIPLGDYDTDYLIRAAVAQIGFGANQNLYATYQNTSRDARRDTLTGEDGNRYELVFNAGETPPVSAFWSVTVYDSEGYLVDNQAGRYAVGNNTGLQTDDTGRTRIVFAANHPEGVPISNWLPIPDAHFEVTLRMYWPDEAILTGDWEAPALRLID